MKVKKEMPTGQGDGEEGHGPAEPDGVQQVVDVDGDEPVVLEPGQEPEQTGQRRPQGHPSGGCPSRRVEDLAPTWAIAVDAARRKMNRQSHHA